MEADLEGYKLHYGGVSRNYSNSLDVGNVTSGTVSNLVPGQTYFMAVTAYDTNGLESDPSNEVIFNSAIVKPILSSLGFNGGSFRLAVSGSPAQLVIIQTTTNLTHWISVRTNLLGESGLQIAIPEVNAQAPMRFFRALLP